MGLDRFIKWKNPRPEWGEPTIEKLATVARDFLGPRWEVKINDVWIVCECQDPQTFALRSERDDLVKEGKDAGQKVGDVWHREYGKKTRGFEIFHDLSQPHRHTSVITRTADEFTGALADRYADIIARWWHGKVSSG